MSISQNNRIKIAGQILTQLSDTNGQPYLSKDWVNRHILQLTGDVYCPACFEDTIYPDSETFAPSCDCGWVGNYEELLSKSEAKNSKRTKLIDKIL